MKKIISLVLTMVMLCMSVYPVQAAEQSGLYTYKFVDGEGTVISEGELGYGELIPKPEETPYKAPTQQYVYTFNGWNGYTDNMPITDDVVFEATYKHNLRKYTYKFVDGSKVYKSATAYYGVRITEPDIKPENTGNRIFKGWKGYTAGMLLTGDITFEAEFENFDISDQTSLYLKCLKGEAAGQIFVDVAVKNNPAVVDKNGDGLIDDSEKEGITAFQLLMDYDTDKFTLEKINVIGEGIGTEGCTINKETATAVWVSAGGLYVTEENVISGIEKTDLVRFVFNVNYEAVSEEDYNKSHEFKFRDVSNATGAVIDFTPVACTIEKAYKVTFKNWDDTVLETKYLVEGTQIKYTGSEPKRERTAQYTYSFAGWDKELGTVDSNIELKAEFYAKVNEYTYKFVDGNRVYKTAVANYGDRIIEPDNKPANIGNRVFIGWKGYTAGMLLTGDIIFEAEYENIIIDADPLLYLKLSNGERNGEVFVYVAIRNNPVVVDFDKDGIIAENEATGISAYQLILDYNKEKFTLSSIKEIDASIGNFTNNAEKATTVWVSAGGLYTSETDPDTEKIIIQGVAEADFVRYVFNVNYDAVTAEDYEKTYEFKFTTKSNAEGAIVDFNPVLYTIRPKEYTVTFKNWDDTVLETKSLEVGSKIEYTGETPVKEATAQYSYSFAGWDKELGTVESNIEFKAVFDAKVNQYTYKFVDEDGSVIEEKTVDYGTVITAPENPADKTPYTFEKWLDYTEGTIVTGNVEFKATYKPMEYNIAVYDDDGNLIDNKTVAYNSNFTLNVLAKEDCDFMGYYTRSNGKGEQLTDAEGNSIGKYDTVGNISAYPYLKNKFNGNFVVDGTEREVGAKDVSIPVWFATLNEGNRIALVVKIPEMIKEYQFVAKDFKVVETEKTKINNGYIEVSILASYDKSHTKIPVNKKIVPFEIKFNIPETAIPGEYEITADAVELIGEKTTSFETVQKGKIKVLPKLAESITVEGKTIADGKTQYIANVYPDYTTNKKVKWSVSDEKVATIDENGLLTPVKNGKVTVIAITEDGSEKHGTIEVEVVKYSELENIVVTEFELNKKFNEEERTYTIYVDGETTEIELTATFEGDGTINGNVLKTDSEKTVALTGEETEIKITVKQNECAEGTYTIKVIKAPQEAKFDVKDNGEEQTMAEITLPKEVMKKSKVYVLVKAYDENGIQICAKGKEVTNETNKVLIELPESTETVKYKAFVWEGIANLKPVCPPIINEI